MEEVMNGLEKNHKRRIHNKTWIRERKMRRGTEYGLMETEG